MSTLAGPALLERLRWRYATKHFDPAKKIPDAEWHTLEQALILTPSSYGMQPWKFIVVRDATLRAELRVAARDQAQVEECSHFVVLAAKKTITEADIDHFLSHKAKVRGAPRSSLDGYHQMMVGDLVKGPRAASIDQWTAQQTYIALGGLLVSAAILGIDTCPMEGFSPTDFDRILGLEGGQYGSVVACAVGYRMADDRYATLTKVRYAHADVIEHR